MGGVVKDALSVGTFGLSDMFFDQVDNANDAINANNAAVAQSRGQINKALSDLETNYVKYGNALAPLDSSQFKEYQNQLLGSLGTGYKKATESIAPQLWGETQPLVDQYLQEILPSARSAAIDSGAYGGSRDMLTRERLTTDLQDTIAQQAAADIADQRAQYANLVGADASQLSTLLAALTSKANLENAQSDYLYNAALNYANAMSGAGTTQAKTTGADMVMNLLGTAAQAAAAFA